MHLDINASGEWTDSDRESQEAVDTEPTRLAYLGATITCALSGEGPGHDAVGMNDPEGNEFDIY